MTTKHKIQFDLEMLDVHPVYLWTRNRRQKTQLNTEEQKQKSKASQNVLD